MTASKAATRDEYARRILRVLVHVQQNLDAALPLEELAAVARFSPFHFHRIFRGMVGESVAQYVRRLRLERAAMQLKHGRRPVTDIAFEAGYEAHEAFTRAFNAAFGCSPSAFRKAAPATALDSPSDVHFVAADADMAFHPLTMEAESMDVRIKTIPPMHIAFVRHVGPYDGVGEAWERLCDWAGAKGLLGTDSQFFGACYDDPEVTDPAKIRYDACITVDESVTAEGDIGVQTTRGGRYATVLHEGPYEKLGETYAMVYGRWLPANGHEPADPPSLEFYLNDPNTTEPEDLQTEVCVPIED